ncbi:MAG: CsbD family protein [Terriglobales bacterium]
MKPSTEDKAQGKIHEVKGKIKEQVGKVTNDPNLEVSGNVEKNAGKIQNLIGHAEKAV